MVLIVEREIAEQMDKLVQERVAECLKTHILQELQDEVASNREPPQHQPHHGSQLLYTGLPMSPRNPPSALQGPSSPTLSHTTSIASPVHLAHPSALPHSSKGLSLTSRPPTSSTPSISNANWLDVGSRGFVPRTAAKLTIKKADGSEVSLENFTKSTPTTLASPQSVVFRQGGSGTPNRSLMSMDMETEDQHKSRLAEVKQNDKLKAQAADKEKKEKEKAEAERKAKVTDEIRKSEKAARLEKGQKEERLRKEAGALELQRLREEEERILNFKQERAKVEKERKEKEEQDQERFSNLVEETQLRLEEIGPKAKAEAIYEPEREKEEAELEAHKGDGKEGQLEDGKDVVAETPKSVEDGKTGRDKPENGLRINTSSDKRRPGPLDLSGAIRSASPLVSSLTSALFITDIATVSYSEGYRGPHPDLNQNLKNGLQFISVCNERSAALPPLDAIGIKPAPSANCLFSVSEERYANSNRAASVSGVPGMQYTSNRLNTMQGTATSQGDTGAPLEKRVRTERNRIENNMVSGGSGQGQGSAFNSNMNQMQNLDPVVPLQATENRWGRKAIQVDQDSPELVERKVKGLLNKLTMEKFTSISDQIIAWANKSEKEKDARTLIQVIRLVFENATNDATWSEIYARLCRKMMEQISTNVQDDGIRNPEGKPITGGQLFRKYLLNRCQEDFERGWVAKEATAAAAATKSKECGTEEIVIYSDEYAAQKAKRQGLGLIKFIGELFKLQMLTERIMHECVKKLLGNDNPEEEEIESLCKLLATVGSMLDIQKARGHLDVYFSRMKELMKSPNVTPRMQYMLQVGNWCYI